MSRKPSIASPTRSAGSHGGSVQGRRLEIDAQIELTSAHVSIARLYHEAPDTNLFFRDGLYWLDLCLTPRRPNAMGRYCSHWNSSRFVQLGSLLAFPPGERLELRSAGGRHVSLICQLQAEAVDRWLPDDFFWSERRLEATLSLASETIRMLMLRLNHELRNPQAGSVELCEAILQQIAIELARYLAATKEPDAKGGLALWRLRVIDERIADSSRAYPSATELAALCRLSVRQFGRAFRTSRGCSISDYLAHTRMDVAKRRLYTAQPLADIARSLGFSSQSSFTAAFRRATGTTPSEFRKRLGRG